MYSFWNTVGGLFFYALLICVVVFIGKKMSKNVAAAKKAGTYVAPPKPNAWAWRGLWGGIMCTLTIGLMSFMFVSGMMCDAKSGDAYEVCSHNALIMQYTLLGITVILLVWGIMWCVFALTKKRANRYRGMPVVGLFFAAGVMIFLTELSFALMG